MRQKGAYRILLDIDSFAVLLVFRWDSVSKVLGGILMKRRTLAAILMLLVFTLGCLVFAPVLRAEFPWDADLRNGEEDSYDRLLDSIGDPGDSWDETDDPDLYWYWWFITKNILPTLS